MRRAQQAYLYESVLISLQEVSGSILLIFDGLVSGDWHCGLQISAAQWATFICFLAEPLDGILRSCGQACVLTSVSVHSHFGLHASRSHHHFVLCDVSV